MKVSVIVPTKNSEEFLEECLLSLRQCKKIYPDMEIIVIDNYSADGTVHIAERWADKVHQFGPERVAQVNYGIIFSKGELIYITGSDMTRDSDFILQAVNKIKEGYDAIYMSVRTDKRVKHFWGRVKALERECYIGTFIESARFFKKSVWKELGFNPEVISLEEDFQHRLDSYGYKTTWINAREYHLHEDDNLKKIFCKAFYYGGFMRAYLKEHKKRGYKQLNPFRPNFSRFLEHPLLLIGLIISKLAWYSGGALGLLIGGKNGNKG